MTDPMVLSGNPSNIDSLRLQFIGGSEKVQQQLISQLANLGEAGLEVLMEFLVKRRDTQNTINWLDGKVYQALYNSDSVKSVEFLQANFPQGLVPLKSDCGIDYSELQTLLVKQEFEIADRLTVQKMCEVAGDTALQRKWLYFTDIDNFPITDLQTINNLWVIYSEGKFGFSVQKEIWLGCGKNWDNLWTKIGWKSGNNWTRYPGSFTWSLEAPKGHLPLSNQLRGVRVISSLFAHPAWG
jgi:hypothetical protein